MNTSHLSPLRAFLRQIAAARVVILFLFHAVVFTACYAFAWLLRFDFGIPAEYVETFKFSFPVVLAMQLLVGGVFGFYRGWWRYVGIADVVRLVFGLTCALVALIAGWYVGEVLSVDAKYVKTPRGVLLIDWAFTLLTLFGARLLIRMGRDRFRPAESASAIKRVLIVGAGDAGETLAREIEHRPQLGMRVVGFVDDQRAKWHSHIRGITVFGPVSNIARIADTLQADEALIAIPSASGTRIREIIHHLADADLSVKTVPGIDQLVSGKVHVTQLRPVNVEDLLRRKRIDLPGDPVRTLFKGKRVMVTGAGGTIGAELSKQVLDLDPEHLVLVERSEFALYECRKRLCREPAWATSRVSSRLLDTNDEPAMRALIEAVRPHIVLHAAAHKHVPLGEENPAEYLRNNALGTRRLAEICAENDVERFVLISTDKAINPSSVMGASKRAAEILLLDLARQVRMITTAVRFGNVIGSSGSVIPLFMEQIVSGGPITVTHPEVTRYFIRTSEAISLVLQAATLGDHRCIFMLDMGDPIKIADLARDLIRLSNHSEDEIPIVFTGLRAGEKLFEEIRLQGEAIRKTVHPQIVITEADVPPAAQVQQWIKKAEAIGPNEPVANLIRQLVPEFRNGDDTAAHGASVEAPPAEFRPRVVQA